MTRGIYARLRAELGTLALDVELEGGGGTLCLIGPNGAGKTSLLSALLGNLHTTRGRIEVAGSVLLDTSAGTHVPVEQRRLSYVPQHYALFPHLSVQHNVRFALRCSAIGLGASEQAARIESALRDFGVWELRDRKPGTLSGGEKQRVALARALSVTPRALLLDEPLAALDVHARHEVRAFLARTLRGLSLPSVVVTHDPMDAQLLAERIAVLESGRITQAGSWAQLCAAPASRFVEEFTGSR